MSIRPAALGAASLLATLPLRAEAPWVGAQVHVVGPAGDLRDAQPGSGAPGWGLHVIQNLGDGDLLRTRFDAVTFREDPSLGQVKVRSLAVEWLWFPMEKPERTYLVAGWALNRWERALSQPAGTPTGGLRSTTQGGLTLGLGYQASWNLGAEVRWVSSPHADLSLPTQGAAASEAAKGRLAVVQATLTIRF